ncbi:hypothetical protein IWQ62_000266 [Dispira parvispora]|uniref:Uncharacterized protein n=1 Tax=Dispira parvispora TaxID=1520584 RepID=A0A9W8EAC6_9FUNG|nr:hypothetical protein IWQ62_000266 [Dispira parvispora]
MSNPYRPTSEFTSLRPNSSNTMRNSRSFSSYPYRPHHRGPYRTNRPSGGRGNTHHDPLEIATTLYVGGIAEGITNETMEDLLGACGHIKSWKRTADQYGKPKGFGFCEYADEQGTLRALWLLGGHPKPGGNAASAEPQGLELPVMNQPGVSKPLVVKADEKTRRYLDRVANRSQDQAREAEIDECAQRTIRTIVDQLRGQGGVGSISDSAENGKVKEGGRKESEDKTVDNNNSKPPHSQDTPTPAEPLTKRRKLADDDHPRDHNTTRTWLRAFLLQREQSFADRERQWLQQEKQRLARVEKELESLDRLKARKEKERSALMIRYAQWDESEEAHTAREEYYYDRSRWWRHRQRKRGAEIKQDELDRERERKEQEALVPSTSPADLSKEETNSTPVANTRVTSASLLDKLEAEEDRQLFSSLVEEKRTPEAMALLQSLPKTYSDLEKYAMPWAKLQPTILNERVRPFLNELFLEYLGDNESEDVVELFNFITDLVQKHEPPSALVKELEIALDEDAIHFVRRLWRKLALELGI